MAANAASQSTEYAHIVCVPGKLGGEPCIDGHRVRVRDVVVARDQGGYSAEEIAASIFPSLTLAEVYAALAYYEDHRSEIAAFANAEDQFVEQFQRQNAHLFRDLSPPATGE